MQSDPTNFIVLDEIRDKIEMIRSDMESSTFIKTIIPGVSNPAENIGCNTNLQYATQFTTFPLAPRVGDVHHIKDSFLHFVINIKFSIYVKSNTYQDIYLYVGPRDTASIFSQLYINLGGSQVWGTTFQRVESAVTLAALPASVVDHSPNYATIDKLLHNKETPMHLIKIPADMSRESNSTNLTAYNYSLDYDLTVDLNRLCVPLSNIEFLTTHYGNLNLRVHLEGFHQSFFYFVMPPGFVPGQFIPNAGLTDKNTTDGAGGVLFSDCPNAILTMNPVQWGTVPTGNNTTTEYSAPQWIPVHQNAALSISAIQTNNTTPAYNRVVAAVVGEQVNQTASNGTMPTTYTMGSGAATYTFNASNWRTSYGEGERDYKGGKGAYANSQNIQFISIPIQFVPGLANPATTTATTTNINSSTLYNFVTVKEGTIEQVCFDLLPMSYDRLNAYFAHLENIIIPIQVLQTNTTANPAISAPLIGQAASPISPNINGSVNISNVSDIIYVLSSADCPCCIMNPFMQNYLLTFGGKNPVQIAYTKTDGRAIQDYTNACIDTDREEINTDYLYSLQFPPSIGLPNTEVDNGAYFFNDDFTTFKNLGRGLGNRYIKNPNLFMHVWQTNVRSSFMTGYAYYGDTKGSVTIQFANSTQRSFAEMYTANRYRYTPDAAGVFRSNTALTLPSYIDRSTIQYFIMLADYTIIMPYDKTLGYCNTSGGLSPVFPLLPDNTVV